MKILSRQQVLRLHDDLLATFGGIAGIRDEGLLDSAAVICKFCIRLRTDATRSSSRPCPMPCRRPFRIPFSRRRLPGLPPAKPCVPPAARQRMRWR